MWLRRRQAPLTLTGLILLLAAFGGAIRNAAAQDGSPWLVKAAPSLNKVVDLPANLPPDHTNVDCTTQSYLPGDGTPEQNICTFMSPLGALTTDGRIQTGINQYAGLFGPDHRSAFVPTDDSSIALLSVTAPAIGNYLGVYRHLTKAALQLDLTQGLRGHYNVAVAPDATLRNPATGEPLPVDTLDVAFSANGEWLLMNVPHEGLLRVHMTDLSTLLFADQIEPGWYLALVRPALAISNDGRYAAANTDFFGTGNLNVYDLSTCTDQLSVDPSARVYCAGKNIWQGQTLTQQPMGQGLLSLQPDLELPTHLRFINDDSLSFNARYALGSPTKFKAATFVATAPGEAEHKLGLLGMGDSYISGQGAFEYRKGTDTPNDFCHLSELSYPFILGKSNFDSYNSIACSGATTGDIMGKDTGYAGQVRDGIPASERDGQSILSNFLPGYIYQQEFASAYTPEAIVLSVGGDDIGFADIVKACVAGGLDGTCYGTYEDRVELVNEIDNTYSKLVATYTTLRQQSGGARLYVVGYPQIASVDGNCGLNVHLNADELGFAGQLISYLDSVIQRAAQTAGVAYVDTQHAFDGHRLCEPGDKAVNGLTAGNDAGVTIRGHTINVLGAESYHPTQLGYRLLASTVATQTANLATPMPIPQAYNAPVLDPALPILQHVPSTGRQVSSVVHDGALTGNVVASGSAQQISVEGSDSQLQPGSKYQVVLHSTPVLLAEGGVSADGSIVTTVHVPADVEPGYHTIHVYGTNLAGESIDIQKVVYVAGSSEDTTSMCGVVAPSGQDIDQDGADDACDAIITASPVNTTPDATVDRGVSTSIVELPASSTTASTANVLGESLVVGRPSNFDRSLPKASGERPELFRLDWLALLQVGLPATLGVAMLSYALRQT